MNSAALALAAALALGGSALAAERAPAPPAPAKPVCAPLDHLKADFDAKTHFIALTPGQFHFVEGLYVGSPTTPDGLPPGDGALLATHDGSLDGMIIWTRGKNACSPIAIPGKLRKIVESIKTGIGETVAPTEDDSDERKL